MHGNSSTIKTVIPFIITFSKSTKHNTSSDKNTST